ncbi:MAG TPA: NUDIX domain-containing protein [Povalibacter sp.]|uniref:NUDIX domain-containing protein n=1 Tax=Povalibacter sp. TaxID=1962978 RepID=UPI002BC7BE4B|nr:NUDIX domain-containing protein [Povalibacter sp.]HMN47116.1 NUDIX domain-containing protein [Povalibacter sp.]
MKRAPLTARIHSSRRLSDGFLKLDRIEFDTDMHAGGKQLVVREIVHRGHAVGVLGYDPVRDEVVLINEFRPGCLVAGDPPFTDNVVAGGMSEDESPLDAAVREMLEETGLELRDPVLAHPGAYVSSGGTTEKIALVVGFVDTSCAGGVHGNADESEDILTVVVPWQEFIERVRGAQITDFKTLVAGYWLAEHRERLRSFVRHSREGGDPS